MFLKDIDYKIGKIEFDSFDINPDVPLAEQIWSLKEDMFLVSYSDGKYMIDIGWMPSFDLEGEFYMTLVKDDDWNFPLSRESYKDLNLLKINLIHKIDFIMDMLS
jgi:hypothetical protein